MASETTSADVQYLMEVAQCGRAVAISFLKRYGAMEAAMNAYFEHNGKLPPEITTWGGTDTWDDSQFHGGREYGPENRPGTSFQVHAQDSTDALRPNIFAPTLSRPPSRVDDKMDTREDADLQQALSLSLEDQESGVTDGTNFRPATRPHYDPTKWAVATISKPIIPNPDPESRKRLEGGPSFIKPSMKQHYIPALLTILHEIPMAKEALLARDAILPDYGIGDDWWDGEPIYINHVVAAEENVPPDIPIVIEAQRVMAFLELTERAYGSASTIDQLFESDNDDISNNTTDTVEADFLNAWMKAAREALPNYQLGQIFQTYAIRIDSPNLGLEQTKEAFSVIKLFAPDRRQLAYNHSPEGSQTLYDALDSAVWGAWSPENLETTYLEFNDVIVLHIDHNPTSQQNSIAPVDCPHTFFVDRYLKNSVLKAKDMLQKQHALQTQIKGVVGAQDQFKSVQGTGGENKSFEARDLLKIVKPFLSGTEPADDEEESLEITSGEHYHGLAIYKEVGKTLQKIADKVMIKFQALEEEKERLVKEMHDASDFYKEPSQGDGEPTHRYTLRGVATDPTTTFVLANPNTTEDLIDTNLEDWQWWKINFSPGETEPIAYNKVDEEQVSTAIKSLESKQVLLVYASDAAVSYPRQPLPGPLRNFVRADNLAFSGELDQSRRPRSSASSKSKNKEAWDQFNDSLENQPYSWRKDSPNSTTAQPDDNPPPLIHASSENSPPPYSRYPSGPPPVPPRGNKKRPAPSTDSKGSIANGEAEGEFKDIDLIGMDAKEMQETSSHLAPVFGTGGAGDSAKGSYASSLRMSDVEDLTTSDPQKRNEDLMQL